MSQLHEPWSQLLPSFARRTHQIREIIELPGDKIGSGCPEVAGKRGSINSAGILASQRQAGSHLLNPRAFRIARSSPSFDTSWADCWKELPQRNLNLVEDDVVVVFRKYG